MNLKNASVKNLTFLIGILFVCQIVFSQTTGKQIFHDDFDNNDKGWQGCEIINGQLVAISPTYLNIKPTELTEDFILTTKISTSPRSVGGNLYFFGHGVDIVKNMDGSSYFHFENYKENLGYIDVYKPIIIKITCINKLYSFYANNILCGTSTFDWRNEYELMAKGRVNFVGFYHLIGFFGGRNNPNPAYYCTTYVDYFYIDELIISPEERQGRDDKIENDFYTTVKSSKDYDSYLTKYPNGNYFNEISILNDDKYYEKAIRGFISECDDYFSKYPSGKHITQIQILKSERILYKSAINGSFKEYDAYILKYPNGLYASEIVSLKTKKLYEIDRQKRIKANSNKALWKTGNKICIESSSGTICGTLMSWNEDKSMVQFKVISGPNTRIEGEQIKPDALIWITPNSDWHICLQDEIDASITQNEDPYKYWKLGKKICLSGTKGAWIFKSSVTITGEIIQWNEDKSKVRIRIIDGADGTYYSNETLYNDKMIWDSPNGWKLCN